MPAETPFSLAETARRLRCRELRASTVFARCEMAYRQFDTHLNAYKTWHEVGAARQAQAMDLLFDNGVDLGPLMGVPVSVKDLYGVPGLPVFAGSDQALPASWQCAGGVMRAVLAQGAVVTGKTHTVEFAFGGLGVNAHWGTPVNPWSATDVRVPGGSSSGAGVSLVQGSALLALGTDTAGSVRVPAAFTGQVGLKTTAGRWPTDGIVPLSSTLDTPGLLARTVADLAYAFDAIDASLGGGGMPRARAMDLAGLRIGVPEAFFWRDADAAVVARIASACRALEGRGAVICPIDLPGCDVAYDIFRQGGLAAPELSAFMQLNFPDKIARLDPVVRARVEGADQVSSVEYLRRKAVLEATGREALSVFDTVDVLLSPTVAIAPPRLADLADMAAYGQANMLALRNTVIANLFGWCALTLPAGTDAAGLPVGLQLMAPPMDESRLIRIGLAVEDVLGQGPELLGVAPLLALLPAQL